MFGGAKLFEFKLLGFDISLDSSWLIIAALITWSLATRYFPAYLPNYLPVFYWILGAIGAFGFFVSILLHEMGHSVVARNYGIPILGISLYVFGGVAQMQKNPANPKQEFMVAAAGPFVSILLGFLFLGLAGIIKASGLSHELFVVLRYLMMINFVLAIFNLIPAFPLDGGRILRAGLWKLFGDFGRATIWAANAGIGFSFLLMAVGLWDLWQGQYISGIWLFFIASFLNNNARAVARHFRK